MVKGDSRLEQRELFQSIANTITATLNLPSCIWVLDEKAQALRIAGAVGLRPAYVKRAVLKLDEPSVTGVVLQTGRPLAVRNILEDERWKYRREAENRGWKSVLCVPIQVADRTAGVISIYTIVEREFSPSEQKLLERYAALIETSLENARRGEMLRRLFEVGQFVEESIAKSPEAVLRRIVKGACEVAGADCAVLYPLDPHRKGFYDFDKIAAYGLQTKLRILAANRPREEDGTGAQISREGQLVVNDIERERPELLQDSFIAREGVRAFMGTALKIGEEALGSLYVNFRRPHPFTQDEQEIIQLLSHQAAIAIYNSRLFEQTKRRADTLAQLSDISRSLLSIKGIPRSLDKALKHIASSAKKELRADMVDLYPYIEETAEFKLPPILVGKRKQPLVPPVPTKIFSDDVIVKIVEGDQPQYFEKAQEVPLLTGEYEIKREYRPEQRFVLREEIKSSAAIPLKAAGETVGVMFVNYRSPQLFEPGQREQIELFANQAAVALYNARLFQQERQRAEAMDLLRQVGVELSTTLDVERVLDLIVAGAMRLTSMESGVIYLIDETGQAVTQSFEHPKGFRHPPPRISKKTGLTWHVIETGKVLIFPDVRKDERVNPAILEKGVKSMIALPLKMGEKVVGVLFLNDLQPRKFTEDEQLLLSTLADQGALAIRNAKLFESEKRRLEMLTNLHSVGQSLVSELDLSQVLEVISQSALEVLEADIVTFYQYFEGEDRLEAPPVMTSSFRDEKPMRYKIYPDDIGVRIVRDGESHFADDVWADPLLSGPRTDGLDRPRFVEREGIKSSAGVLLKVEDEIVGVMFVNYRCPITFGPEMQNRIEIFANQAALAIRNARLYEQLERRYIELETEYIAREQLAALGTATAALQHRISNTLNLVNPGIMRLRRRIDPNDKDAAEILDIMERNVRYTSQIISRLQEPLKEEIATVTDVNSRLKEIVQDVREKESEMCQKVSFDLDGLSPGIPRIEIGTGQLTEVLRNLVENACKAMQPQGGTLTISSRLVDRTIEVEFQDTGPGIPPNIRERLFTRPVPPKDFGAGTGLGLWLSKLILQKYGGDIEMKETSEGEGTTMLIRLPTIQQPTTQQAESEDAS